MSKDESISVITYSDCTQPTPIQWWQADPEPAPEPEPEPSPEPEPEPSPQAKWPDEWRQQLAGEDEKSLKQLQRYSTPEDVWKKARALEQKLSSGEYQMALSKEPTEEEIAEFRKINGIPEKPEEYDLELGDGFTIGEEDKPIIDGFLKSAHEAHMRPEHVKSAINWYYQEQERMSAEREAADDKIKEVTEDELRAEFGNNYRREMTMVQNFLNATFPAEFKDKILGGRLADGTPIGSSKDFVLAMNKLARELNPTGTLTGVEGADAMKGIEDRINEIKSIMRKDRPRYNRDNLASEMEDLVRKREAMKGRSS